MKSSVLDIIFKIILIIIVFIFIITILTKRFLYFSPKHEFLEVQENYDEFKVHNLYGWLIENNNPKIIIYFSGNDKNISYRQNKILSLHQMNYNVLIFDYSGFGRSSGIPNEQQLYDDSCLITSTVLQKYNSNQIVLYGEQLGCSIATYIARRYNIPTLILESPLPSIKYIFTERMRKFFSIFFTEFNTELYLNGYKGRTLILYNFNDDNINNLLALATNKIIITDNDNLPFLNIKNFIENE
jgi:pimeloyl-ACP methyl ester carboxylesterase